MLYIVSTPIGNMKDITFRAVETLKSVDYILTEDTRRTGTFLKAYEITKPMVSFNEFSERSKTAGVISDLKQGKDVALVSDAGTPLLSDPGYLLVKECAANDILVSPIPGASALLSSIVCSGLPVTKFTFYGFLSKESGKRKKILTEINERGETAILYESPYRVQKTIKEIAEMMPDRQVVIARELTKKFEEFIRGSAKEVHSKIKDRNLKGEFAIIIN